MGNNAPFRHYLSFAMPYATACKSAAVNVRITFSRFGGYAEA